MKNALPLVLIALGFGALWSIPHVVSAIEDDAAKAEGKDDEAKRKIDPEVLADPSHKSMNLTAPDTYEVLFKTTKGNFTIAVTRDWAPNGADRFYSLVKNGFYDETKFFRVVEGFVVQWGIHGNPEVSLGWYDPANAKSANLKDDPRKKSNAKGTVTFANAGPNTRSTQIFVNTVDNKFLDNEKRIGSVFAPFGVVKGNGLEVIAKLYGDYPLMDGRRHRDPSTAISQGHLARLGNKYLNEFFPKLDGVISATLLEPKKDDKAAE